MYKLSEESSIQSGELTKDLFKKTQLLQLNQRKISAPRVELKWKLEPSLKP